MAGFLLCWEDNFSRLFIFQCRRTAAEYAKKRYWDSSLWYGYFGISIYSTVSQQCGGTDKSKDKQWTQIEKKSWESLIINQKMSKVDVSPWLFTCRALGPCLAVSCGFFVDLTNSFLQFFTDNHSAFQYASFAGRDAFSLQFLTLVIFYIVVFAVKGHGGVLLWNRWKIIVSFSSFPIMSCTFFTEKRSRVPVNCYGSKTLRTASDGSAVERIKARKTSEHKLKKILERLTSQINKSERAGCSGSPGQPQVEDTFLPLKPRLVKTWTKIIRLLGYAQKERWKKEKQITTRHFSPYVQDHGGIEVNSRAVHQEWPTRCVKNK